MYNICISSQSLRIYLQIYNLYTDVFTIEQATRELTTNQTH